MRIERIRDNRFDPTTGMIEGDHLRTLAGIGIHRLIERVNQLLMGSDRRFTYNDIPAKVRPLVEQAEVLADQLEKCVAIHVSMAPDYIHAQAKLAGEALPLMKAEVLRREQSAREAQAQIATTLTGNGGALVAAGVAVLLRGTDVTGAIEVEAQLSAWRAACAICRDAATGKTVPRWLTALIAAHEAHKLKAAC